MRAGPRLAAIGLLLALAGATVAAADVKVSTVIAGGKVYGRWPGLDEDNLYQRADLAVTTDYRLVLSEILSKRLGERRLDQVFPDFAGGEPLGPLRYHVQRRDL